jgi:hypothetical protein
MPNRSGKSRREPMPQQQGNTMVPHKASWNQKRGSDRDHGMFPETFSNKNTEFRKIVNSLSTGWRDMLDGLFALDLKLSKLGV